MKEGETLCVFFWHPLSPDSRLKTFVLSGARFAKIFRERTVDSWPLCSVGVFWCDFAYSFALLCCFFLPTAA